MGKETSIFDEINKAIEEKSFTDALFYVVEFVGEKYGVDIWFVEIFGKRWSYLAGTKKSHGHSCLPQRIRLNKRYGIVADSWEKIPSTERKKIIAFFQSVVKKYE